MPVEKLIMKQKNVRLYTLGCKVNQYETQAIRESFERLGVRDAEGEKGTLCDFVVLNTCTVTRDADKTNRYWIRRLRREHPKALLAVTGCYVEKNREDLEVMPEVDRIFSNREKALLAERVAGSESSPDHDAGEDERAYAPLSISRFEGKTRAFVKIQDGCNHACSFCKVSLVRGRSRSRGLPDIEREVAQLCDAGYREIVLTGIQLGAYGLDFGGTASQKKNRLPEVIERCASVEGVRRIRLSSIELTDISGPLIETFRKVPKLCPHLHIPLQSGDDGILRQMNRRYTSRDYTETVARLRDRVPDFELSVDVMAGFPGETEEQFRRTLKILEIVKPLKSHVFPYSRREGTPAARFPEVPLGVLRERTKRLIEITERISRGVRAKYIGRTLEALAEHPDQRKGSREGRAPNYLKVFFEFPRDVRGCIIPVTVTEIIEDGCFAVADAFPFRKGG